MVCALYGHLAVGRSTLGDIEGPIDKSLGTKEALAVRLRKLAIDSEKTLQGVAELAYQQSFRCSAFSV